MNPQISIVIPLFNEEEVFNDLIERLKKLLNENDKSIEVVLVNDGSSDSTEERMQELSLADYRFRSVMLSRNFGHQIALSAGLANAKCTEVVFILDGDLQDPPELLDDCYIKYKEGYDVVYAVRTKRKDGLIKKMLAKVYYKVLQKVSNIYIPLDTGDFGLISRRVVDVMNSMPEESRYLRGMRAWVGFKQIGINFERDERVSGKPKYTFSKSLKLAFNGFFSFSELPVRFITRLGLITVLVALIYWSIALVKKMFFDIADGYTSLLFAIILFSGVQLFALGTIGEYVLRIFFQTKSRPLYIVDKVVEVDQGTE